MNIKLHIVAPYESMLAVIKECLPLFPELSIHYSVGDLEIGVQQAVDAEQEGADLIISRGGTARLIKRAVTIPVIDMQLSGYDMIRSLMLAGNLGEKTAIVGFANLTSGAQAIIDLLDLPLKAFTVTASEEVAPLLLDLKGRGYKQIAGDVITLKTANAYGLKGFLIQSGKESIVKALEDAKLIYGYLHNNDHLLQLLERMIQNKRANLVIVDANHRILYEKLTDFDTNPLTSELLTVLNSELTASDGTIDRPIPANEEVIRIEGYRHAIDGQPYHMYVLRKNDSLAQEQAGLRARHIHTSEPLADNSPAIRQLLQHVRTLYRNCEPICLQGGKGTGKSFIADSIHTELASDGTLLTIDLQQIDLDAVEALPLSHVSTVKLLNIDHSSDDKRLTAWIERCRGQQVRIFILVEQPPAGKITRDTGAAVLVMPYLHERPQDIEPLAHYFLSSCHQRYGTTAVKLQAEALAFLQGYSYPNQIDDLKQLIKQLALNEKEYVIQEETIRRVISRQPSPPAWLAPQGTLKDIEKEVIQAVLQEENYNQTRTAERLGINRATLWRKLKG